MDSPWTAPLSNEQCNGLPYGCPFVDKPSFEGLPPVSLEDAHTSLLVADQVAADWERVESLFERNWFGPCKCLGSVWGSARSAYTEESRHGLPGGATLTNASQFASASTSTAPPPHQRGLLTSHQQPGPLPPLLNRHAFLNGTAKEATSLYGAAAAPLPEPPFLQGPPKDASPLRPVPVPKRPATSSNLGGDDGPLPPALPIAPQSAGLPAEAPSSAAPVPTQPAPSSRPQSGETAPMPLAPQLGTWADRQYRLLEPVPERGEAGHNSSFGNSNPSSVSNHRSPDALPSENAGRRGGAGSIAPSGASGGSGGCGSGGCGSGDYGGGSSSSNVASQAAAASPTLLDAANHKAQANGGAGYLLPSEAVCEYDDVERGRQRPGHEGLLNGTLNSPQRQQQQQQQQAQDRSSQTSRSAFANANSEAVQVAAEAMMQEAAWRWRFTRRWQAEQSRTGADHASSAPGDQLEEALAYLHATNATTTVSMQIANAGERGGGWRGRGGAAVGSISMDGSLVLQGTLGGTLGGAGSTLGGDWPLGACGSGSGSFTSGPKILQRQTSGEMLAASREVALLNRRAAVALQQQLDCERQAERRVQESLGQGQPWVGHFIPVVQIDEWGSFRFLMLKLRDQSSRGGGLGSERQRVIIRGHNYGSEGQLMEECNREILALSHRHSVPFEAPTVMGGGVMEWRRDRDRHLHLHSGFVTDRALPLPLAAGGLGLAPGVANGGRPASAMDLLNLAAALARQSFPPTYKITVLT